jgi:alkylated DNA repair dioxygenase AlkB
MNAAGPIRISGTTGASQLRLFEGSETRFDPTFASARRITLDEGSWLEHVPGWLARNETLLVRLARDAGWEQRQRWMYTRQVDEPRLTAEYPVLAEAPDPLLRAIGTALSRRYGVLYDSAWLNLYRDHRDSTAWHADRGRLDRCVVPVLSLGETRRFALRPKSGGASSIFVAEGGDLFVMGGFCQRDWVHGVPKESARAGMRISVNFGSAEQSTRRT